MSENGREIEAKFYVQHLERIRTRLPALGGRLVQARVLETNIRYDLPDLSLRAEGRVLRLRRDNEAKLTYKGGSKDERGVLSRQEIEFVVGDFEKAKQFLEALGYRQIFFYEKYRTTYKLDEILIMLDELPYGDFVEIEGDEGENIRDFSTKLGLDPDAAIGRSYSALFDDLRDNMSLSLQDLSFAKFENLKVTANDLRVSPADIGT